MATEFPVRARRDDRYGHMVVQQMLEWLRDAFDKLDAAIREGSGEIAMGNTSVTVTHSLGKASYSAVVTPTVDPGGRTWISNKTATTFVFNSSVAAPIGGIDFDWLVKGVT